MSFNSQTFDNLERDISDTGEAINECKIISPRYGLRFKSIPLISKEADAKTRELSSAIDTALAAGAGEAGWDANLVAYKGSTQAAFNDLQSSINGEFNEQFALGKTFYVEQHGIKNDGSDNTAAYVLLEEKLTDGDTVKFAKGKYLGSFVSNKALTIEAPADAELIQPYNQPLIKISSSFVAYSVVETELTLGAIKFTISGVVDIQAGSLVMLWNSMMRDATNPVNFETLKVHSFNIVDGNTVVFTEKPIQSVQYGIIIANVCKNPIQAVTLDLKCQITNNTDHWARCIWLDSIDNLHIKNIKTRGTKGHAISVDRCYNIKIEPGWEVRDPIANGSGAGYGLALHRSSSITVGNGKGFNMRHDIDIDSCYDVITSPHTSFYPKGSAIVASHNGFIGNVTIGNLTAHVSDFETAVFGVSTSGQGYKKLVGGQYVADKETRLKHPIRNLTVGDVNLMIDEHKSVTDRISGVNIETELINPKIGHIDLQFKNTTVPPNATGSVGFLTTGNADFLPIAGITANVIAQTASIINKGGSTSVGMFRIDAINIGTANYGVYTAGYSPDVASFQYDRVLRGVCVECSDNAVNEGQNAVFAVANNVAQHRGASSTYVASPISANFLLASGNSFVQGLFIGTSVQVTEGAAISSKDILIRNGIVVLSPPNSTSSASIGVTLPTPVFYNGQTLTICNGLAGTTDRSEIVLSGINMALNITIASGKTINLVSVTGKWRTK